MGGSLFLLRVLCLCLPVCLFFIHCFVRRSFFSELKNMRGDAKKIKSLVYATGGQAFSCSSTPRRSSLLYPVRCIACLENRVVRTVTRYSRSFFLFVVSLY